MDGQWWMLAPNILYFLAAPMTAFYFFCQYCGIRFRWLAGAAYIIGNIALAALEWKCHITGAVSLVLEMLLLTAAGGVPTRGDWAGNIAVSALVTSVRNVCGGTARLFFYWLLNAAAPGWKSIFRYWDAARETAGILLAICFFLLILKYFRQSFTRPGWPGAFLIAVPAFYISLVERTIRDDIYGNTLTIDTELGLIAPEVEYVEILFLQLFACVCLFLTLAACRKITDALLAQQTMRLLRQQTEMQETYIREARSRYERTRAFRHDVKNHLTVLAELLRAGRTEDAQTYLSRLDAITAELSYSAHTGCAAADALLGSKLEIARREGIDVTCELKIPRSDTPEIDWCILLSNAIDNAINAIQKTKNILADRRFIRITGRMQGNFYLLSVENGCNENAPFPPEEGVGLANIRAVAGKYGGTVHLDCSGGVFRLDILLVISRRENGVSQQSPLTNCPQNRII